MPKDIVYRDFYIHLNQWGEYCVVIPGSGRMVSYNSGFESVRKAKQFINQVDLKAAAKDIESLAKKMK